MPGNDVIIRTQQLRDELIKLASSSETAGTQLGRLESILNVLKTVNLTSIRESTGLLTAFNQNLRLMSNDADAVNKVTAAFVDLVSTMQKAQLTQKEFSAYGKAGVATKRYNAAMGLGDQAQMNEQRNAIDRQKQMAEEAKRGLANLETFWKDAITQADKIIALRKEFMKRLLTQIGFGYPQLPAGRGGMGLEMEGGIFYGGPGGNLTGQLPNYPPALPPGNRIPRLPAGTRPSYPLLPAVTGTQPTQPQELFSEQELESLRNQYIRKLLPTGNVQPAPLMLPAGPIRGGGGGAPFTEVNAEDLTQQARAANETASAFAHLGYTERELEGVRLFNEQTFRDFGLSETASKSLSKELENLGMKQGFIRSASTEMSTGITTVSLAARDGTGVIQNFTAHLDRNGNVLQDTQKRFRSFGSAVMRDVVEVLKWTIAITAIYTPIRKMGELLEQMRKIQLDMVDVQIVLGDSTKQFGTVLEASSQIASETSSTLEGVIQGYSLAAAAAASAGDETQRTVATQVMLKDSMVLSKLANIDQKQALDTLVGSLSQLGMGLTQGTQLLDSWVAVSKKANVSVNQMATSFTIVGSAAQEAGVNYNELNALIGALAQSTNLSADELGNAIRGIIAAMQTDKAQQAFAEYGIATKTVSGDFRDLMDILKQLKQMSESGILDEKAMGALTQAGGAGARRGAQLSALIKNLDTVMSLITVSENASGDAAQALGLELGTLDAAATRLSNAFAELATTLGTEGGLLGFLTAITNAVTALVRGFKDLTSTLKVAAPILASFMLARGVMSTPTGFGLLNKNIPLSLASMLIPSTFGGINMTTGKELTGRGGVGGFAPVSNWLLRKFQGTGAGAVNAGYAQAPDLVRAATFGELFSGIAGRINRPFFPATGGWTAPGLGVSPGVLPIGLNKLSLGTLLGPALIAATNIGQPGGTQRGIAGGIGALPGIIAGSGVWATVGSIIATAFYDKFLTYTDDMATTWATKMAEARKATEDEGTPEAALERLNREARESMGAWEIFKTNVAVWGMNTWSKLPWSTQGGKQTTQAEISLAGAMGALPWILDEETKKKVMDAYNQLLRNQATATEEVNIVPTPQQEEIARLAATASGDIMNSALEQISIGAQGSIQNYLDAKTLAQKVGSTVTQLINAQMLIAQPVTVGVGAGAQTIAPPEGFTPMTPQEATKFVSGLNQEELGIVVNYYTEVADLLEKIRVLNDQIAGQTGGVPDKTQQADLDAYAQRLKELPGEFIQMQQAVQQGSVYRKIQEKFMPTIDLPEMTPQQFEQVRAAAEQFWREYLLASGLTPDEANMWIKNQQEQIVMMQNQVTQFRTNIPQEYFTPAMEGMGFTGQMPGIVDWTQYTNQQFQQAMSQYPQFIQSIQKLLPTWKPDESDALYFLKDNATVAHLDQQIMQLLMRDLIDVEKEKGLQGMYNLPSGATFYVPVTAYELHKQTQHELEGGGGGISAEDIAAILQQAINQTATARLEASQQQFEEAQKAGIQDLGAVKPGEGFTFGGKEYKMFGPAVPEGELSQYTTGNPLPVLVTNFNPENLPNQLPPYNPSVPLTATPQDIPPVWTPQQGPLPPNMLQQVPETTPTWFERLEMFFQNLFQPFGPTLPPTSNNMTTQGTERPISTALNLSVDQKVILTVDGRTLATIIKPYLYEDLIRFNTATTSSVSKSVIA